MPNQLAHKLRSVLEEYEPKLRALTEDQLKYKPLKDKWSKTEILGHLIDSAYNNHRRFVIAENQGNLIFDGYDQVNWVLKNNYQNRPSEEVISHFISVNRHLAFLIGNLDPNHLIKQTHEHNFDRMGMQPIASGEASSLKYLIEDYIFHLLHHLRQIV